ncbi:MAG: UvrB/UvrC motif-containing protein, partial [bacterium]
TVYEQDYSEIPMAAEAMEEYLSPEMAAKKIERLKKEMRAAAAALEFEKAAELRDELIALEKRLFDKVI